MDDVDERDLLRAARVWRAVLDRVLGEGRQVSGGPRLGTRLEEHLGAKPSTFPVVTERWAPHEHADVQLALEHWLAAEGAPRGGRRHAPPGPPAPDAPGAPAVRLP